MYYIKNDLHMRKIIFFALAFAAGTFTASAVEGELPGRFTINAEGDTVHFSKGNLYYESGNAGGFYFSDKQYESRPDGIYSGNGIEYRSLFGFGTSGWANSGAVAYNPMDTIQGAANYLVGGSAENGLTGDYAYADWGIYNAIRNGGNMFGLWRTLSMDEWVYILSQRENAQKLFTMGRIKYIDWFGKEYIYNGMILLPDNWVQPEGVSKVSLITDYGWDLDYTPGDRLYNNSNLDLNTYILNTYTSEQWEVLEAAGAVFLPAEGYRKGSEILDKGANGCYISSTPHGDGVCSLEFTSGNSSLYTPWYSRHLGYSVRLVTRPAGEKQGIENTPSPLWGESERGYKLLRNGQLLINRNGKTYNATGAEVR